jgi:hypothetical protein
MLRHRALLLGALALLWVGAAPPEPRPYFQSYVGPSDILFADADTVVILRTLDWHSANVRHQEKLLRHALRLRYWREHIPADMRSVYDALGYPTGRVLLTPVGHSEEHWYYGQLDPPLVFRDGTLLNRDLFERMTRAR